MTSIDKAKQKLMIEALKNGGHVFALRGSGKTYAIAKLMIEDPMVVTVQSNEGAAKHMKEILRSLGMPSPVIDVRVFLAESRDVMRHTNGKKVIVDEWVTNSYRGGYHAAISSLPYGSVVFE